MSAAKGSLISDVADAASEARAKSLDRWSRVPLRYGGLGVSYEDHADTKTFNAGGPDLAEALLEEDEVMIALTERRERFQNIVNEDLQSGRSVDQSMVRKITTLTRQIEELKHHQVF